MRRDRGRSEAFNTPHGHNNPPTNFTGASETAPAEAEEAVDRLLAVRFSWRFGKARLDAICVSSSQTNHLMHTNKERIFTHLFLLPSYLFSVLPTFSPEEKQRNRSMIDPRCFFAFSDGFERENDRIFTPFHSPRT